MSSSLFRLGQTLGGRSNKYVLSQQLQTGVWVAKTLGGNESPVIVKGVFGHFRVVNERNILKHFNGRSPYIRPMIDEIREPNGPVRIVLRYLESDLAKASAERKLTRKEVKYVSRRVLQALKVMHSKDFVHADVKPRNVMVNYTHGSDDNRFSDVQLADMGGSFEVQSKIAREGLPLGTAPWRSPEILLELPWDTKADIWSFGAMLISLMYGDNINLFEPPGVSFKKDDPEYNFLVLRRQTQFFGPFPSGFRKITNDKALEVINRLDKTHDKLTPFNLLQDKVMTGEDKDFICWIMKIDSRDRPTAEEVLAHKWWDV
ncbi:kinase-like domain-containing protein [Xylariales sp. PMI_506]|nr:kinase-like domain-containing protein [Xylariales sp. PMI_506]